MDIIGRNHSKEAIQNVKITSKDEDEDSPRKKKKKYQKKSRNNKGTRKKKTKTIKHKVGKNEKR